jgi:hypothetical protein
VSRQITAVFVAVLIAACAGGSHSRQMTWNALPGENTPPQIQHASLILDASVVRSDRSFTMPVSIRCDVDLSGATNGAFYIDFVPLTESASRLPREFVTIKLDTQLAVSATIFHGGETTDLLMPSPVSRAGKAKYRINVEAQRERLVVNVNDASFEASSGVPYEKFYVQLRSLPPPTRARVLNVILR